MEEHGNYYGGTTYFQVAYMLGNPAKVFTFIRENPDPRYTINLTQKPGRDESGNGNETYETEYSLVRHWKTQGQ
jgi:hypothetical protein